MQQHPLLAAVAVAGLGLAIGAVRKGRPRALVGVPTSLTPVATAPSVTPPPAAGRGETVIVAELEAY